MKTLFPPRKRDLLAKALMTAFALALGAAIVSDAIWSTSLKAKLVMGILLIVIAAGAWMIYPLERLEEGEDNNELLV